MSKDAGTADIQRVGEIIGVFAALNGIATMQKELSLQQQYAQAIVLGYNVQDSEQAILKSEEILYALAQAATATFLINHHTPNTDYGRNGPKVGKSS